MDHPPLSPQSSSSRSSPGPPETSLTSDSLSFDLSLDPSDPLNFLMPGSADSSLEDTSSSTHDSPSEWPPVWQHEQYQFDPYLQQQEPKPKQLGDAQEFHWPADMPQLNLDEMGMNVDMEFDPAVMDQHALFDPALFAQAFSMTAHPPTSAAPQTLLNAPTSELLPSAFVAEGHIQPSHQLPGVRRLSVTSQSSSSASGASLSPINEYPPSLLAPDVPHEPVNTYSSGDKGMDELAERARQIVGVMMALPVGADGGAHARVGNVNANQSRECSS